ncbi:MAG: PAS domain-containing protein, partial [Candidatus Thorarchaeota archaeon]
MSPDEFSSISGNPDESLLRAVIDNSPVGILIVQDNSIIYANNTFAKTLNRSLTDIMGLPLEETVRSILGGTAPRVLAKYNDLVSGKINLAKGIFTVNDSKGNQRAIEIISQSM